MNRNISILLVFIIACFFAQPAFSQAAIVAPYSMGFELEDSVELANWVLNPGTNASKCTDQWVVGDAIRSDGKSALYISSDQGASAKFGVAKNVQYVYRDFTLPKGNYEITFDWACIGGPDAVLRAGVGPASNLKKDMNADAYKSSLPKSIDNWCQTLGVLKGTSLWKNASLKINSNGTTPYRLFFVWSSANTDSTLVVPMGGCIDNIQICSAVCAKPGKISVDASCDSIVVTWEGTSEKYNFQYRRRGRKWSTPTTYYGNGCVLTNVDEGLYDFRVRGICNDVDTSVFVYLNSKPVFCPEKHCINYVALDDSLNVTCTYGTYSNPEEKIGVQDFGSESKYSRHTVNWESDVYDPRTCNQLPLIPEGELASVRLGNWDVNAQGECVFYNYVADIENAAIMLLKYAVVMEDPGHNEVEQPRFTLEIFDKYGELLSPTCGTADFYADAEREDASWHVCNKAPGTSQPVAWKEWTTIGLNLEELGVQTGDVLTIKLTTRDCKLSGHYGYAYFTLGCAAAKIVGTSCGNESSLSVEAPDGFRYEWYNKYDSLVATTKELSVSASDTTTYRCRLVYMENDECDFNLYTSIYPRFPISDFSYTYQPSDCQNKVIFHNRSHIFTVHNNDSVHHYDELCEDYTWLFANGEESGETNPMYIFPQEGGTFPVTLYAAISDGTCVDDTTVYVTLPAIGDYEHTIDSTICDGDYIVFGKYYAAEERLYYDSLKTIAGCDSVTILNLKINPTSATTLPDTTICAEDTLCIDGDCYWRKESGEFIRFLKNRYGCDSTVWMHVNPLDSILPIVDIIPPTEEGILGSIAVDGTGYDYYLYNGVRYDKADNYIGDWEGGIVNLQFYNSLGCFVEIADTVNVECLTLTLGELNAECAGSSHFVLPFVVDSGFPTTYTLLFDSAALAVGFANHVVELVDKVNNELLIPIPQKVLPGKYEAELQFDNVLPNCDDPVFELNLVVNFSSDMIFQRWSDVLSIVSAEQNYGIQFEQFQWVKNGEKIEGANKSYYYEADGLDLDAEYQIEVVLPGGLTLTTCPFIPIAYTAPQESPKKIIENQRLIIIRNNVRYNAQGMVIQSEKPME